MCLLKPRREYVAGTITSRKEPVSEFETSSLARIIERVMDIPLQIQNEVVGIDLQYLVLWESADELLIFVFSVGGLA